MKNRAIHTGAPARWLKPSAFLGEDDEPSSGAESRGTIVPKSIFIKSPSFGTELIEAASNFERVVAQIIGEGEQGRRAFPDRWEPLGLEPEPVKTSTSSLTLIHKLNFCNRR